MMAAVSLYVQCPWSASYRQSCIDDACSAPRKACPRGRVVAYEVASQHGISQVHLNEVAMICISYLDISGSPSHLRYLIRRLKQKALGVPIFVGLWPAEDSALKDVQLQGQIGANYFTTSLREAVNACMETAVEKLMIAA